MKRFEPMAILLSIIFFLTGCASTAVEPIVVFEPVSVDLSRSESNLREPLNVSILLFSSADDSTIGRIYQPVRSAEAGYLPVVLKDTLVESGYWGAVSVVPSLDTASELFVTGEIVESNALKLALRISVRDSRGVVWVKKLYEDFADPVDYQSDVAIAPDPFQDLFNTIANDMATFLSAQSDNDISAILDTAMLRYAILLSPEAFSSYLSVQESGELNLEGLPARNDVLYQKVQGLREREFSMQDVIDAHFNTFAEDMHRVYPFWRQSSFELLAYNQKIDGSSNDRVKSSWQEVERVYRLYKERKLNEDELRELASSFEREIEPTVAELEGRVIELQGSLIDQYQTWRRLLQQIYQQRVGPLEDLRPPASNK